MILNGKSYEVCKIPVKKDCGNDKKKMLSGVSLLLILVACFVADYVVIGFSLLLWATSLSEFHILAIMGVAMISIRAIVLLITINQYRVSPLQFCVILFVLIVELMILFS